MERKTVTKAINKGIITQFKAIFKVYHYSQKKVREATGLKEKRLRLLIHHPEQATPAEIKLIASHLHISAKLLRSLMAAQINEQSLSIS